MTEKKKEEDEKGMRLELEFLFSNISFMKNDLEQRLENTYEEHLKEDIKKQIREQELRLDYVNRFKGILDNIIEISKILENDSLTDEERKFYVQKRDSLRSQKSENTISEIKRRLAFHKENPHLLKKTKRPEGILGNPKLIKYLKIGVILLITLPTIIIMIIYFILKI